MFEDLIHPSIKDDDSVGLAAICNNCVHFTTYGKKDGWDGICRNAPAARKDAGIMVPDDVDKDSTCVFFLNYPTEQPILPEEILPEEASS